MLAVKTTFQVSDAYVVLILCLIVILSRRCRILLNAHLTDGRGIGPDDETARGHRFED